MPCWLFAYREMWYARMRIGVNCYERCFFIAYTICQTSVGQVVYERFSRAQRPYFSWGTLIETVVRRFNLCGLVF